MTEPSSFPYPLPRPYTAEELVGFVSLPALGQHGNFGTVIIDSVAAIDDAQPGCICFVTGSGSRAQKIIEGSKASLMVVDSQLPALPDGPAILQVPDAAVAFAEILALVFPQAEETLFHAPTFIDASATLPDNVKLGVGVYIGRNVLIGTGCHLGNNVVLHNGTVIGNDVRIQDGAIIGGDGHGYGRKSNGELFRWRHLGRVILEDDVEIGMNSVVASGMLKDTYIGCGTKIGQLVSIGHNCKIGANCFIATRAALCGSVNVDDDVRIGAGALINNKVSIGEGASIGLGSVVTKPVAPHASVFGNPAVPVRTMRRI